MFETFYSLFKEWTSFDKAIVVTLLILLLVLLVTVIIIIIKMVFKSIIKRKNTKYANIVKDTSLRYKDILSINSEYDFYELRKKYTFYKLHNSKTQFDRFDHTKFLDEQIEQNMDFFELIQEATVKNNILVNQYKKELLNVSPFVDRDTFDIKGVFFHKYKKMEEKIVSNTVLHPVLKPKVVIESCYISPKGRNRYDDNRSFSYSEIVEEYNIVCEKIEKRASKESQRKMMTDSLRYDIMKRDGFRCVLCGRSADDGVKLHVDHIIPVSKGGKTIPDNLRTLCNSCNFGKRDKYDKYGIN